MARQFICITIFNVITLWQTQTAACVEPTQDPPCTYPPGSIACKIWNYTNMDCSRRELNCIPPLRNKESVKLLDLNNNEFNVLPANAFFGFDKLETLDISSNFVSSLQNAVFNGLHNLLNLDLKCNSISVINETTFAGLSKLKHLDLSRQQTHKLVFISSPFQDLISLETLLIETDAAYTLTAIFTGLNSLQMLHIKIAEFPTCDPFSHLPSLLHLSLDLNTCNITESLLNGLIQLQDLQITQLDANCGALNVDFCPLVSLHTLTVQDFHMLNLTDNCLETIPLKSLHVDYFNIFYKASQYAVTFEMFNRLSSLTWTNAINSYTAKLLFHQSPTRHSDYTVTTTVTM